MLFRLPALLVAIVFHEYAHGAVSDRLGDPTPRWSGRLTLNPLAHLDVVGTLMLVVFGFGWAKPVPVNPLYYSDRRRGLVLVGLAGPLANVVLAFLALLIWKVGGRSLGQVVSVILYWTIQYNVWLSVFNLIPIPPLDGSRVLAGLLRGRQAYLFGQLERQGWFLLLILLWTGLITVIMVPISDVLFRLLDALTNLLTFRL